MPRLLGIEIPGDKRIEASITYIYGIGPKTAKRILERANINPDLRAKTLTPEQIGSIIHAITDEKVMIEGDLRRELQGNLKRLQAINCYRGIRHRRGLPVRGQRTSTNARTRKGPRKTVGVARAKRINYFSSSLSMSEETSTLDSVTAAPEAAPAAASEVAVEKAPKVKKASKAKKTEETAATSAAPAVSFSLDDPIELPKIIKAKGSKNISHGIAHVQATFNNTIVSVTDLRGAVLGWSSAGKMSFKGSRKSTAYAAQVVAQDACRQAMGHGLKEVEVRVKGPGSGRESAVRAMQAIGLEISVIRDVTPVPHNGCRPPKQRRV